MLSTGGGGKGTSGEPRAGMPFTRKGKRDVIEKYRQADGSVRCADCGVETVPAQKSESGVTPPANDLRVTVDTREDLALVRALVAELPDAPPAWRDVVAVLRARPDLVAINSGVEQKPLEAG